MLLKAVLPRAKGVWSAIPALLQHSVVQVPPRMAFHSQFVPHHHEPINEGFYSPIVDDLKVASIWSDEIVVAATSSSLYSDTTNIMTVFGCFVVRRKRETMGYIYTSEIFSESVV
jgi:hypothetical protein